MSILEKIKLLFKVREPATELISGIKGFKAGYRTPSFWVTVIGSLLSMVAAFSGIIPEQVSLLITVILTGLYNITRGMAKLDQNAIRPTLKSTEFWVGVLGIVSTSLTSLHDGGINPAWMVTAQSAIAAAMAASQNLGVQAPPKDTKKLPS